MVWNDEERNHAKSVIKSFPDFPKPGILFRDVMGVVADARAFRQVVQEMARVAREFGATAIVGPEARGFIFGCPVAYELGLPFIVARKKGKLPGKTIEVAYGLEYGEAVLQVEEGAFKPNDKVVIVDDLLATGGTVSAIAKLVHSQGVEVVGACFLLVLDALEGDKMLPNIPTHGLFHE